MDIVAAVETLAKQKLQLQIELQELREVETKLRKEIFEQKLTMRMLRDRIRKLEGDDDGER